MGSCVQPIGYASKVVAIAKTEGNSKASTSSSYGGQNSTFLANPKTICLPINHRNAQQLKKRAPNSIPRIPKINFFGKLSARDLSQLIQPSQPGTVNENERPTSRSSTPARPDRPSCSKQDSAVSETAASGQKNTDPSNKKDNSPEERTFKQPRQLLDEKPYFVQIGDIRYRVPHLEDIECSTIMIRRTKDISTLALFPHADQ